MGFRVFDRFGCPAVGLSVAVLSLVAALSMGAPAKAQFGLNCPGTWIPYGGGQACQCPDGSLANYVGGQVVCGGGQAAPQQYSAPAPGMEQAIGDAVGNAIGGLFDGLSNLLPPADSDQQGHPVDEGTGSSDADVPGGENDSYVDRMSKQSEQRLREKVGPDQVYSARQGYMGPGKYRHCDGSLWHHATFEDHFSRLKSISCGGVPAPVAQPTVTHVQPSPAAPNPDPGGAGEAQGILDGLTKLLPFLNQQQPAASAGGGGSYVDQMSNEAQRNLRGKVGPNHVVSARQGYMGPGQYRHCDGSLRYYSTHESYWAMMKQIGC